MSSKKQKLTPWFGLSTPPVRVGPYEISEHGWGGKCFSFFDGKGWNGGHSTPNDAAKAGNCWSWLNPKNKPRAQWRGLAEDPNA